MASITLPPPPLALGDLRVVADAELLGMLRQVEEVVRAATVVKARVAGEIARRSSVAAGHAGLAARLGERSAEKLVQRLTGVGAAEARQLTAAGVLLREAEEGIAPWLAPVAGAVVDGTISVAGAAAAARGLGEPSERLPGDLLEDAAVHVVEFAKTATPEETAARARATRDELDVDGVADRERILRGRRSMTWKVQADGTTRVVMICDPESAAIVLPTVEAATAVAATRSEVRFLSAGDRDAIARTQTSTSTEDGRRVIGGDATLTGVPARSPNQARLDALVDLLQLAARAANSDLDPEKLLQDRTTGVRVHVQARDLESGRGIGHLEGQSTAVSIDTVTRHICTSGILPVLLDGNTPIDTGRRQRLHSTRQRIALAAAWGGCAFTGCDQPEHACEVHHSQPWNGNNTTLTNGIPLCRFHHVEVHANHWRITKEHDGTIWLDPPPGTIGVTRRRLESRSPLHRTG